MHGIYTVYLALDAPREITVGARGPTAFRAGTYCYVGSGHGPGGVHARITRHRGTPARRHWHIDHVSAAMRVLDHQALAMPAAAECTLARALAARHVPVDGIGATDCDCAAHLFRLTSD